LRVTGERDLRLSLSDMALTVLPPEIGRLGTGLAHLELKNCALTELPPEIGKCRALTWLDLSGNALTSLPPELQQCKDLTFLFLDGNRLQTLPEWLRELATKERLRALYLHGNGALGIPQDVLGPTWQEVSKSKEKIRPASPRAILKSYFSHAGAGIQPKIYLPTVATDDASKSDAVLEADGSAPANVSSGIEPLITRPGNAGSGTSPDPRQVNIFIGYSHKNTEEMDTLRSQLRIIKYTTKWPMDVQTDKEILAGKEWSAEILRTITHKMDIFLFLLSMHALDSEFLMETEVEIALERHHEKTAILVPIILEKCPWEETRHKSLRIKLSALQALPYQKTPVRDWDSPDNAWHSIREGLTKVIEEWRAKQQ